MTRRLLLFMLLLTVVLSAGGVASAAPDVSVVVRAANEGRVRSGSWVTVLADLTNQGPDTALEMAVSQTNGSRLASTEYVVPVQLPAGGKKRVSAVVPLGGTNQLQVVVRTPDGKSEIYNERLGLSLISPDQMLIGVLSDDELGLPALSRLGQATKALSPQVVRLDAASMPTEPELLADFNLIALSRFDSGNLAPNQVAALTGWVARGGTLLLVGGPEWRRTFAGLPESLLPVTVTGVGEADLNPLAALVEQALGSGTGSGTGGGTGNESGSGASDRPGGRPGRGPVSLGQVRSGRVEAAAGDVPLLVQDQVGAGKVVYLAADPGLEPMAGWQGQAELLSRYLWSLPAFDQYQRMDSSNWALGALQQIPGLGLPPLSLVALLLLGYLMVVGPGLYWALKRLDRREWAWVAVPVFALLFVGVIYGMGFGRRSTVLSQVITTTELEPGSDGANLTAYVGVYAPTLSHLNVSLPATPLVQALQVNYGPQSDNQPATRIQAGEQTTLQFSGMNNYSMRGFATEQETRVAGGIELTDVTMDSSGVLQVRLVNHLGQELKDVRIAAGGAIHSLGNMAPGARSDPFLLGGGGPGPKVLGGMLMDAVPNQPNDPTAGARRQILGAVFGPQGMTTNRITVIGWTDQPVAAPSLPTIGRQFQGVNLVYAAFPLPAETTEGDIPPGVVEGVPTDMNNMGRSGMGYSVGPGDHVFRLVLPQLDPAKVADVKLYIWSMGQPGTFTLAAKDQKTGEWIPLDATKQIQSLPEWQRFVGAGGLLEVRVGMGNNGMQMALPTVSVKGVGH